MAGRDQGRFVKRFTSLSIALDSLQRRKLVLRSPATWDDTNDSYFMALYQQQLGFGSVLALCCTRAIETYHHWKIFTDGKEGICIEFKRPELEAALNQLPEVRADSVEYINIEQLKAFKPADAKRLPFVKRYGYRDEREWRIVASCPTPAMISFEVDIELSWINRLLINPWMQPELADNLRPIIRSIDGCSKLRIESSRLTNSRDWKAAGKKLCPKCA